MQTKVTAQVNISIFEQILRHGITLIPAIKFAVKKSKFHKLAMMRKASLQTDANGKKTSTLKEDKCVLWIIYILSPISIIFGFWLGIFVMAAYLNQSTLCYEEFGPVAACMKPRYYFQNGFFEGTTCAFGNVTTIDCSSGNLDKDVVTLRESNRYSEMINLKTINFRNNPQLKHIPKSWSSIPNIEEIDMSDTNLIDLPYLVCATQSLKDMKLDSTPASIRLNWTGQVFSANHASMRVSSGCLKALRNLEELVLASNKLTCSPEHYDRFITSFGVCREKTCIPPTVRIFNRSKSRSCSFAFVKDLPKLRKLDLTNNTIENIRADIINLGNQNQLLNELNAGIILSNNPISFIEMFSLTPRVSVQWLKFLNNIEWKNVVECHMNSISLVADDDNVIDAQSGFKLPTFADAHFLRMVNVKLLEANYNLWTNYRGSPFQNMKNLKLLTLKGTGELKVLARNSFLGAKNLDYIEVHRVLKLITLEPGCFNGLERISELVISDAASLKIIPLGIFTNLPKLKKILVDGSYSLHHFEMGVFDDIPSLEIFEIRNSNLQNSDFNGELLRKLINLKELNIINAELESIPLNSSNTELKSIQEVNLNENKLTHIQRYLFSSVPSLRYLTLARNRINEMNPLMFAPQANLLKHLSLSYNRITEVKSETISKLCYYAPNMIHIDLSGNPITAVDSDAFLNCSNLKTVLLKQVNFFNNKTERLMIQKLPRMKFFFQ
jgi:Leucine-rich repeat (LRR) protein